MQAKLSNELMALDATAQALLIKQGDVQPLDLVNAAIAQIERFNPQLNAVITLLFDKARETATGAQLSDGPFHGVPLLLKDFLCETKDDPYYAGMQFLKNLDWHAKQDTYLATLFRRAGFIFLGKTNLPELAGSPMSQSAAFGPTRNPWNQSLTPGGSSCGSAAAVAARMVAVAHANDGTGSIRIPASLCGLVGLKPSRGRVSIGPSRGAGLMENIAEFVLTRSVRDAAGILDAVAKPMPGDRYALVSPPPPYRQQIGQEQLPLRIGLLVKHPFFPLEVHQSVVDAVEQTGQRLESFGHHVEYAYPQQLAGVTGLGAGLRIISTSGVAAALGAWSQRTGQIIGPDDVEPSTWARAEEGRKYSAVEVHQAYQRLVIGASGVLAWWHQGFDLLVTPVMAQPKLLIAETDSEVIRSAFGIFTMPFSFTGQPAISLPVHFSDEGLPIGVQLVADLGREDILLRIATQLEESCQWQACLPKME